MRSKEISKLLACVMTTGLVLNPFASTVKSVYATTNNLVDVQSTANATTVYLSDLEYDAEQSFTEYDTIKKDTNIAGQPIRLKVNGEVVYFPRGIGAHATSSVVYDVSEYSSKYTRLVGYFGIDCSQSGKGNGVKFTVSTSENGQDWTPVKETGVVNSTDDALYLDIDIEGAKFIKLYADSNGAKGNDHSIYGDIKIVQSNYNVETEMYKGVEPVSFYDNILSTKSVEENYNNYSDLILRRELVNRLGYGTIQATVASNPQVRTALDWLMSDRQALELFIESGSIMNGSPLRTLNALGSLYANYKTCLAETGDGYVYKKMLVATASAYAKDIRPFIVAYGGASVPSDPVVKFGEMKKLYDENLFPRKEEFKTYNMELMRFIMDARIDDEEISWLRHYSEDRYPNDLAKRLNGYSFVKYISPNYNNPIYYDEEHRAQWDEKYSLSKYGVTGYGDPNRYRLWMAMEAGGICWGISGTGQNLNEVHGIPALTLYQPQHEVYMLYTQDDKGQGKWDIWNNVSGWAQSFTRWGANTNTETRLPMQWGCKSYNKFNKNNGSYLLLGQAALNRYEDYKKSMYYNLIANSYAEGSAEREDAYNKALEVLNINLDSFDGLINTYKASNKSSSEWTALAKRVIDAYTYYPLPMVEALDRISEFIINEAEANEIQTLKAEALDKASKATNKESLQPAACKAVANSLKGEQPKNVATLDVDDKNMTIKLDESFDETNTVIQYSTDNEKTWKTTDKHEIELSKEEVEEATNSDGISVNILGSDDIERIPLE